MREYGVDRSGRRAKHVNEFAGQRFDTVITLCDRSPAFQHTAADINTRIGFLLHRIRHPA